MTQAATPHQPDRPDQPGMTDEFYVGYLGMPRGHRRFLAVAIPVSVFLMAFGALMLASSQEPWGDAVWHIAEPVEFTGVLYEQPYPMLDVSDGPDEFDHVAGPHLLVLAGKLGPPSNAARFDGLPVRVSGYVLERDGRSMIELAPGDQAIVALEDAPAPPPSSAPAWEGQPVTLRGEIVDSKCFLGAMKPGSGRTHKACATLCIVGGIPPVLVTLDPSGAASYHLLTDPEGRGLGPDAIDDFKAFIGEPVEVTGRPGQTRNWKLLAIDAAAVSPL